jgi:hypothetical protein
MKALLVTMVTLSLVSASSRASKAQQLPLSIMTVVPSCMRSAAARAMRRFSS